MKVLLLFLKRLTTNNMIIDYLNNFVWRESDISITDDELKNIGKDCLMLMIGGSSICLNESTKILNHNASIKDTKASLDSERKDTK